MESISARRTFKRIWIPGISSPGLVVGAASLGLVSVGLGSDLRTWTSIDGRTLEATLVDVDESTVRLRLKNGKVAEVLLDRLSPEDRAHIEGKRKRVQGITVKSFPEETRAPEVIKIEGGPRAFLTPNFRIETDQGVSKGFVGEAARVFEGTLAAIRGLPLGLEPKPPEGMDRYQALFVSREAFDRAVASRMAPSTEPRLPGMRQPRTKVAGVYSPGEREVVVPFSSLGVIQEGSGYALRRTTDTSSLIHEITHQVMHDWLAIAPAWFCEGMAEYLSAVRSEGGRFDFKSVELGLKESLIENFGVSPGEPIPVIHPADLLQMSSEAWRGEMDDYRSALLLIYFFMHLDQPNQPGASLAGFLHLLGEGEAEAGQFVVDYNQLVAEFESKRLAFNKEVEIYNATLEKHQAAVREYNRRVSTFNDQLKANLAPEDRIEVGEKPVAPKAPTPPEAPEQLKNTRQGGTVDFQVLIGNRARPALVRERDFDQLGADFVGAFGRIGISLELMPRGETYVPATNPVIAPEPPDGETEPGQPKSLPDEKGR